MSEQQMIQIVKILKTCDACPAQWEGQTEDGRAVYVRYRWGWLSVCVSENPSDNVDDAVEGVEIFGQQLGDAYAGVLSYEELVNATQGVIEFPT